LEGIVHASQLAVLTSGLLAITVISPANPAVASPVATAVPTAAANAPVKQTKHKVWAVSGRVYLAGLPVQGGTVSVSTLKGRTLKMRYTKRRTTTRRGMFSILLASKPPAYYRIKVTGGKIAGKKTKNATLYGIGRLGDPLNYVNMATTLLSRYQKLHPEAAVKSDVQRVARYLGFPPPKGRQLYPFAQTSHLTTSRHDPAQFYRMAKKHGGVNSYLQRIAKRVKAGQHIKANLVPKKYFLPAFGTGSALFHNSGDPRSRTSASAALDTVGGRQLTDGGLAGDLFGLVQSSVQWAAGNAAQGAACAKTVSGIVQGLLGCNASQGQAAQIESTLNALQAQVSELSNQVSSLQKDYSLSAAGSAWEKAQVPELMQTLQDFVGWLAELATVTPNPINDTTGVSYASSGPSITDVGNLCDAAYPSLVYNATAVKLGSQSTEQTPNAACTNIGAWIIGDTNGNEAPPCQTDMTSCMDMMFDWFAGYDQKTLGSTLLLIPLLQNAVASGGAGLLPGSGQNHLNQTLATIVGGQAALLQILIAWQGWYESWSYPNGVSQILNCAEQDPGMDLNPPTASTKLPGNWNTTCDFAQNANTMLSIEFYMAQHGARASMPNLYGPETPESASTSGVVLDTIASMTAPPAYWAVPVDLSGASYMAGNTYWPYFPYGPAFNSTDAPGYNTKNNPLWLSMPGTAGDNTPILNAYPNDAFSIPDTASLQQIANDAHNTSGSQTVAQAMNNWGFIGIGEPNTMWWTNLAIGVQSMSWQTENAYPGTPGTPKNNNCSGWPVISGYQGGVLYGCGSDGSKYNYVTGLWGNQFINTAAVSAGNNNCPTAENAVNVGDGTTGCTGPENVGSDPSYFTLLIDQTVGTVMWTSSLVTSWSSQKMVPSFAYGAQKMPWAVAQAPATPASGSTTYILTGSATAAMRTPSATASVSCELEDVTASAGQPPFQPGNTTTLTATPGTVSGGALQSVSCTTGALTAGHQYSWRLKDTQSTPSTVTFDSEPIPFTVPSSTPNS
jgi:hypothetical protein